MHLQRLDLNLLIALDALLTEQSVTKAALRAYFGDRDRSFRLKVTGHFGAS